MSHGKLREDKNCLNCGSIVEEKFCPNCGQENSENRKPFHYLFTHFIEDFTHYDGQFWGTIKNLLFKPGKLTETYIEGKRQRFVPPVKLYIFISFLTFFLFALFPPFNIDYDVHKSTADKKEKPMFYGTALAQTQIALDSLKGQSDINTEDSVAIAKLSAIIKDSTFDTNLKAQLDLDKGLGDDFVYKNFKNRKSYDSAQAKNPSLFDFIDRPIAHQFFTLKEKGVKKVDIARNLAETALHNLPKALFIYLPVFAFFLWLFHNKKKWWYFEHGVFTLHYFSFLLLTILLLSLLSKIIYATEFKALNILIIILMIGTLIYSFLYFFMAHRRVYHNSFITNLVIGFVILTLNYFAFLLLVIGLAAVSFVMIH